MRSSQIAGLVDRWCEVEGVEPGLRPSPERVARAFPDDLASPRPGVDPARLLSWERRFGFALPESLKSWLRLSDGLRGACGPLVHPLSAIGPMVPFARFPGLVVQPESWFELGNPNVETVCIDLGYRRVDGDCPLFTSGDDEADSPPKLIARGFTAWFLRLLDRGGAEFWFDPDFVPLGDPWAEHRRNVPAPSLPDRLRGLVPKTRALVRRGFDERQIASGLEVSRGDVEAILRHLQHAPAEAEQVADSR